MTDEEKQRMENVVELDRISSLPNELIDSILDKLPMPDVVRTSILSKRWIYCWKRSRNLDFSTQFFTEYIESGPYDLVNIIDSVLSLHNGPIHRFYLHLSRERQKYRSMKLSKWIHILSKNGVKDLSLSFDYIRGIPSNVFECYSLQHLCLENCVLQNSDKFRGFRELVSLKLKFCDMPLNVETITSNSPLLEKLEIEHRIHFVFNSDAPRGAHLKSLIHESHGWAELMCCEELPELTYALILSEVNIPTSSSTASKLNQFSCFFPRIEKLVMNWMALNSFTAGDVPIRLESPFRFLKHLNLQMIDTTSIEVASVLFCILRSSPNLQSLTISEMLTSPTTEPVAAATIQYFKARESEGVLSGIRTFKLDIEKGTDHIVSLIRAIIKCCPKLKTVILRASPMGWFTNEVRKLPRLSIVRLVDPHVNFEAAF